MTESDLEASSQAWPKRAEVDAMTDIPALWTALQNMHEVRDRIKSQLDTARSAVAAGGEYSAAEWYRKAEQALRIAGRTAENMQFRLGELKRRRRLEDASAGGQRFVEAARRKLPPDVFQALMEEAWGESGLGDRPG